LDELRLALELATEDELEHLTQILFCRKFNPLDYLQTPEPIEVQSQDWETWLDDIEQRFRYLAADGMTVLLGKTANVSYRQALIQVCRYLKIPYSQRMETTEIEGEIFLHLMGKTWKKLPQQDQKSLQNKITRSLAQSSLPAPLPVHLQHNPIDIFLKGSSAVAISSVIKPLVMQQIARQFALQTAKQGMAVSAARYGAVRTVFAFLGPALWATFMADLGWRAIATNYGRIIPVIFTLAQIRLTRAEFDVFY
jgi:uncharacterized protein YaaW (UPF0174 family)